MSRKHLVVSLLTGLLLFSANQARAQQAADGWTIIKQAIKAKGGRKVIAKHKAVQSKEEGTYYGMGDGLPYTSDTAFQMPNKFRMEVNGVFTLVFDGKQGWVRTGDDVKDMDAEQVKEKHEEYYTHAVSSLAGLNQKRYKYVVLDESKVGERAVVGVKVESKGHRPVTLWFDKQTHLLAKAAWKARSEEQGGQLVDQEIVLDDYKPVDGEQYAHKITIHRGGKRFVESKVTEMKTAESLDADLFKKP